MAIQHSSGATPFSTHWSEATLHFTSLIFDCTELYLRVRGWSEIFRLILLELSQPLSVCFNETQWCRITGCHPFTSSHLGVFEKLGCQLQSVALLGPDSSVLWGESISLRRVTPQGSLCPCETGLLLVIATACLWAREELASFKSGLC